jgi:hypothetical protein
VYSFGVSSIRHFPCIASKFKVRKLERRRRDGAWPPRERLHAREQLLEGERLGHVVVRAGAQRGHLGVDGVLRSEHEHGTFESFRPQRVEHFQPGLAGQSHVQDDEVVRFRAGAPLAVLPVGDQIHGPSVLFQPALHILPYGGVVFDDEDSHCEGRCGSIQVARKRKGDQCADRHDEL